MRITQWGSAKTVLLHVLIAINTLLPFAAKAGLSDCTMLSAQLLEPEQEQVIAVAPGTFEIGDFVGAFRYFQIRFNCKTGGIPYKWGAYQTSAADVYNAGISVQLASWTFQPVFTTTQLESLGLGIAGDFFAIAYQNEFLLSGAQGFQNTYQAGAIILDPPAPDLLENGYFGPRLHFRYRLVKINNNLDAILNTAVTTSYPTAFPIGAFGVLDNQGYTSPAVNATIHIPTLHIQQRACTPFAKDVSLPGISVDSAELAYVGSTGATTNFNFTIRCPHNAARYGYYVESVHGYEDEPNGVIKIDPNSTAKGIGLQITTREFSNSIHLGAGIGPNYEPIKFGPTNRYGSADFTQVNATNNPLSDVSDYTFPNAGYEMKVAVYRTGNLVPGSYTAALKVYMVYR